jgi:hypothetical protein
MALLPDPRQNFQLSYCRKVILYIYIAEPHIETLLFQWPSNWPNFIKVANLTKILVKLATIINIIFDVYLL